MENTGTRSAGERRFTLLTTLAYGAVTMSEIKRIPAYESDKNPAALNRTIERDIEILRKSGYTIHVEQRGDEYLYRLDESSNIELDAAGLDVTLLRFLLGSKQVAGPAVFAQSGITKLLGSADLSESANYYSVSVPQGDVAVDIAPAIQLGRRIEFSYRSTNAQEPARYVVEPWRLEVHFNAFYLRAYLIRKNRDQTTQGVRLFKVDRITSKVTILDETMSAPVFNDDSIELVPVDAVIELQSTELPLARKATRIVQRDRGYEARIEGIEVGDLYDDLIFHGESARLIGPQPLVDDYNKRLAHLGKLGDHGEN